MDTPTIIALIACLGACISGVAAAISAYLNFKSTRPKIKVSINRDNGQCLYTSFEKISFALLTIKIINTSMVSGIVDDIRIIYNGEKYLAEDIYTKFDPYPMDIKNTLSNGIERDTQKLRLKCPIKVDGYSIINGFVVFPAFPVIHTDSIIVDVSFKLANRNRIHTIKKVRFSHMNGVHVY